MQQQELAAARTSWLGIVSSDTPPGLGGGDSPNAGLGLLPLGLAATWTRTHHSRDSQPPGLTSSPASGLSITLAETVLLVAAIRKSTFKFYNSVNDRAEDSLQLEQHAATVTTS